MLLAGVKKDLWLLGILGVVEPNYTLQAESMTKTFGIYGPGEAKENIPGSDGKDRWEAFRVTEGAWVSLWGIPPTGGMYAEPGDVLALMPDPSGNPAGDRLGFGSDSGKFIMIDVDKIMGVGYTTSEPRDQNSQPKR